MSLTLKWWNEQKNKSENKVSGKVAPETEFEKKLKIYEPAKTALDKEHTIAHCDAAQTALTNLESARKASIKVLVDAGFKDLSGELKLETTINKVAEEIHKIKEQLLSQQRTAKAATHEEAMYEALWDGFEKLRDTAKSVQIYKLMLVSLDKLQQQAHKAGNSDVHLVSKYNQLSKGLAGIKEHVTQDYANYHLAIQNAVRARQQLLPSFNQLTPTLQQTVQNLTLLKAQGQQHIQAKNSFLLNNVKSNAKSQADAAVHQYAQVTATFASGTPLRDGTDYKNAHIHSEDVSSQIEPSLTALISVNKTNIGLKKSIDTLAGEVAALKVQ